MRLLARPAPHLPSLALGLAFLFFSYDAGACARKVDAAGKFVLQRDLAEAYTGDVAVTNYLYNRANGPHLSQDVSLALDKAFQVWGLSLNEFGSLSLKVLAGNEGYPGESMRIQSRFEPEVREHRLMAPLVHFNDGPMLSPILPGKPSREDLRHLRNTVHYGLGLTAYSAFANKHGLRLFRDSRVMTTIAIQEKSAAERALDRARETRGLSVGLARTAPLNDAAVLIATAFARESAPLAGLSKEDFDALMAASPLKESAIALRRELDAASPELRPQVLLEWSYKAVDRSRNHWTDNQDYVEWEISDADGATLKLVREASVKEPQDEAVRAALGAIEAFSKSVETNRVTAIQKSQETLDRALAQP